MAAPLSTLEQLLYSTVRVEVDSTNGVKAVGTGFFASLSLSVGTSALVLVGNKHLLQDASIIQFWVNLSDREGMPSRQFVRASISSAGDAAFLHPNPETDLAAVVVTHLIKRIEDDGDKAFYRYVPEGLIPTADQWAEFDVGEDVVMMGCPWGIHDDVNKLPLARRGAVASYLPLDFNGKPEFIVDIASFEGSSGSPIFLNSFIKFDRTSGQYEHEARSYLLGILKCALEVQTTEDAAQCAETDEPGLPLHLGVAIKSTELHSLYGEVRAFAEGGGNAGPTPR